MKMLFVFVLFFKFNYAQKIKIVNNSDRVLKIGYFSKTDLLKKNEAKTISAKEINYLDIQYNNEKNVAKHIPVFLNSDESLEMTIDKSYSDQDQFIQFKGDKDSLHSLIINQQHGILYKNVVKYQDIYYKRKNTKELINLSELVLADYFNKINKSLNATPLDKEDEMYKRLHKYVINDWVASVYLMFSGGKTLDLEAKDVVLYYYNKYIKKDIENYRCEYSVNYNIISELATWKNQLNITLPKYPIVENTEDDSVNQYLPQSCQKYYFINYLRYYDHISSPRKEYYKKVLKEKFNN